MKKQFVLIIACFLSLSVFSQTTVQCVGIRQDSSQVAFLLSDGSALQITVLQPSVLKIWYDKTAQFQRRNNSFAVLPAADQPSTTPLSIVAQKAYYEFKTSDLRVRVKKQPMQLQIFNKYERLIFADAGTGRAVDGTQITSYKKLSDDEHIIGLGEKTGPIDKRGRRYKMWNSDKPCYSVREDPLYKSIPFFMSSKNYGLFLDNTYKTTFDFGKKEEDVLSFSVPKGEMIYYFFYGKDYSSILQTYTTLTGAPIMPPKWAFGWGQCRGLLTSEKLSLSIAEGYRKRGIPCDIIYQDIGWTQHLQDFEWRKGNYKHPKQMLATLKKQGFKVVVSQDPVVSQDNKAQWIEAHQKGYFVKDSITGTTYDMPWPWGGNCGIVDFTLPEVAHWWGDLQQKPVDDGIAGFWTDMGEPAWCNEDQTERLVMQHHLGMHDEIHNVYGLTWDKVVKEQWELHNPNRRIFQMTRAGFAGMQRYTFAWTGDCGNGSDVLRGWKQMSNQIPVMLSLGLGGVPFSTCDITGYCGEITDYKAMAELFVRWVQMGIFTPLSRIHHEGNNAVEPWLFGAEAEACATQAIRLKYRLLPYLYTAAYQAYCTGAPILRPLCWQYPADETTYEMNDTFMWGDAFLVAPVLKKHQRRRRVYLPEGTWINYHQPEQTYEGETWVEVPVTLNSIPMFVKKGTLVPTMPVMNYVGEQKEHPFIYEIFPAYSGESASCMLYEDDGETLAYQKEKCRITTTVCRSTQEGYELSQKVTAKTTLHDHPLHYCVYLSQRPRKVLMNNKKIKKVRKQTSALKLKTSAWYWDKSQQRCVIYVPTQEQKNTFTLLK
jgi:alpha-glucosidase